MVHRRAFYMHTSTRIPLTRTTGSQLRWSWPFPVEWRVYILPRVYIRWSWPIHVHLPSKQRIPMPANTQHSQALLGLECLRLIARGFRWPKAKIKSQHSKTLQTRCRTCFCGPAGSTEQTIGVVAGAACALDVMTQHKRLMP